MLGGEFPVPDGPTDSPSSLHQVYFVFEHDGQRLGAGGRRLSHRCSPAARAALASLRAPPSGNSLQFTERSDGTTRAHGTDIPNSPTAHPPLPRRPCRGRAVRGPRPGRRAGVPPPVQRRGDGPPRGDQLRRVQRQLPVRPPRTRGPADRLPRLRAPSPASALGSPG